MFYKVCSELTPPRYDYRGSGSKLNLRKEERMTLLRRATTDWYEVEKQNGERGLVPSNYLEEVSLDAGVQEVYYRVLYALAARGNQLALRAGELLVLRKKLSADWYLSVLSLVFSSRCTYLFSLHNRSLFFVHLSSLYTSLFSLHLSLLFSVLRFSSRLSLLF